MKNHLLMLFIGLAVFLIGIAWFYLETIDFDIDKNLTNNLEMEQEVLEYEIEDDETFRITNFNTNKNMNLYIDNSLSNEVRIVVVYPDIMRIKSGYYTIDEKNLVRINIENELVMNFDTLNDLYDLGIISLKNKTLYNYSLLKYSEVRVFVNEDHKENIEFVGTNGKAYNPVK